MTDPTTASGEPSAARSWLVPVAVTILLTVGSAFLLHGSFSHFVFALLAIALAVIAAAVLAGLRAASRRTPELNVRYERMLMCTGLVFIGAIGSFGIGVAVAPRMLESAQHWCEAQIPAIEAYREQHGSYPAAKGAVPDVASAPWVARVFDVDYHSNGEHFALTLYTGPLSGWSWYSGSRTWSHFD
jgi:hypothetical protein